MVCEWRRAMYSTDVLPKGIVKKSVGFICVKGQSDKLFFSPVESEAS